REAPAARGTVSSPARSVWNHRRSATRQDAGDALRRVIVCARRDGEDQDSQEEREHDHRPPHGRDSRKSTSADSLERGSWSSRLFGSARIETAHIVETTKKPMRPPSGHAKARPSSGVPAADTPFPNMLARPTAAP